jgi:hypothetical protein
MKYRQKGATAVEFALVLMFFLMFLLGIVDFSRMLYMWNAANEATRAGARYAVVCDNTGNSAAVLARMQLLVPQVQSINLAWDPPSCDPSNCVGVTVTIQNMSFHWISPLEGFASLADIPMPTFRTYLTREVMRQDPNSGAIC